MRKALRRGSRFVYKEPSFDDVKKRAEQKGGGDKDSYFKDEFNVLKTPAADYCVRFLPPTWEKADHWGYIIWVHRGIGADRSDYLCLKEMKGEACPLCEEREAFPNDPDYAVKLKSQKRYVVWLVNRDDEKAGAMLWSMAWTLDRDIARIRMDKRTQEVYSLCDTEGDNGYDLNFTMEMVKSKKYSGPSFVGFQLAKRNSPLFPDEADAKAVEDFIWNNPIPSCLQFHDYEYIKNVFAPSKKEDSELNEVGGKNDVPLEGNDPEDVKKDKEMTWEGVHKLTSEGLDELAIDEKLFTTEELADFSGTDEELADTICEDLKIGKPSSGRAKLKTLRDRKRS